VFFFFSSLIRLFDRQNWIECFVFSPFFPPLVLSQVSAIASCSPFSLYFPPPRFFSSLTPVLAIASKMEPFGSTLLPLTPTQAQVFLSPLRLAKNGEWRPFLTKLKGLLSLPNPNPIAFPPPSLLSRGCRKTRAILRSARSSGFLFFLQRNGSMHPRPSLSVALALIALHSSPFL